jgi:hypothetical protein
VDWRNDVYVVTQDTILDIERKPLSKEKKSAPLASIAAWNTIPGEHPWALFIGNGSSALVEN